MRDESTLRAGFERWLAHRPDGQPGGDVRLSRPQAGLSSETLFVDVTGADDAEPRESLVVRVPPEDGWLFPDYSLQQQARVQQALAATDVPVAAPVGYVDDDRLIGAPFLVMPRVPGRVLPTRPSYLAEGWLHDATPADRARLHADFLATMARIHRLDRSTLDVGELSGGGPSPESAVEWWREYLEWANEGDDVPEEYARGLEWCEANLPDERPASLLWGDPQLVNAVFDDAFRAVALLDWEMASCGPAEVDLAWFLGLHEMTIENVRGGDHVSFPARAATIARYEELLGRALDDLHWYDVFATVRSGAIVTRVGTLLAASGVDAGWVRSVPQLARLRRLLGDP